MEEYEIVGIAANFGSDDNPYIFRCAIGPYAENQAIVSAYGIVAHDTTPQVAEYRLLKRAGRPKDVPKGIVVHKGNVPLCDECWKKIGTETQTHYFKTPAGLERCSVLW